MRRALLLGLLAASACRAGASSGTIELRPDWESCDAYAFELMVAALPEEGGSLTDADLALLGAVLARQDAGSVRAAVLLSRSADPSAGRVLLDRLETRDYDRERHAVASFA